MSKSTRSSAHNGTVQQPSRSHRWVLKTHTKSHNCELICHTLRLALRFPLRFAFRFLGSCEVGHADALYGVFTRRTLFIGVQGPGRALRQAVILSQQRRRCLPHPDALHLRSAVFVKKSGKESVKKFGNGVGSGSIATRMQQKAAVASSLPPGRAGQGARAEGPPRYGPPWGWHV